MARTSAARRPRTERTDAAGRPPGPSAAMEPSPRLATPPGAAGGGVRQRRGNSSAGSRSRGRLLVRAASSAAAAGVVLCAAVPAAAPYFLFRNRPPEADGAETVVDGGIVASAAAPAAPARRRASGTARSGDAAAAATATDRSVVVEHLVRLALEARPSSSTAKSVGLRRALREGGGVPSAAAGGGGGDDDYDHPFDLPALRRGECPWRTAAGGREQQQRQQQPDWLPRRSPEDDAVAERFRRRHDDNKDGERKGGPVAVYYEHLSKAGGTSFCRLARANMRRKEIPPYSCMPNDPDRNLKDGRVGNWTASRIATFVERTGRRVMSNERVAFNSKLLDEFRPHFEAEMGSKGSVFGGGGGAPSLLFLTSIRHPVDRLLSAYKFLARTKEQPKDLRVKFPVWIQRQMKRRGFRMDVARFNFATWKFSGGALGKTWEARAGTILNVTAGAVVQDGGTIHEEPTAGMMGAGAANGDAWVAPFRLAIDTLSRFDLVIPTELLSDHPGPVGELLGWANFEKSHVVPSGKVRNTTASRELTTDQYDMLWEANWLDVLIHAWVTAVYYSRMNCAATYDKSKILTF